MKYITNRFGLKSLAAAVLGICVMAPVAQARDHDHDDVNFGVDLSFNDRDHHDHHDRADRVWVDAVWRNDAQRVWVDPVWVQERVWVAPVTKDVVTRVWVEPAYEDRVSLGWDHGRRVQVHVRVKVADGYYQDQHSTVVAAEGHWVTTDKWVLKTDGHWETRDNWVLVSDGHYEDRVYRPAPVVEERRVDIHFGGH